MEKIRVLQFVESLAQGGIENFVVNVYKNLDANKIDCDFLVLKTASAAGFTYPLEEELTCAGAKITYLIDKEDAIKYAHNKLGYINSFYRYMKRQGYHYDVIHVHASHLVNFYPFLLCMKCFGVKKIIVHSHSSKNASKTIAFLQPILRGALLPLATINVACGVDAGNWMFGNQSFQQICNGIELKRFEFDLTKGKKIRDELSIPYDAVVLGHVGAFRREKNHEFLINVFEQYHKLHKESFLILIGSGLLQESIKEKVQQKDLQNAVLFLGNRLDIPDLLCAMDCFVFPSLYEGMSIAMVETQANGLPMVISNTIPKQIVMNNLVDVCSIENKPEVHDIWVSVIEKRIHQGRSGIEYYSRFFDFDIRRTAQQLEDIYESNSHRKCYK